MEGRRAALRRVLRGAVAFGGVLGGGSAAAFPPVAAPAVHTITIEAMRFEPPSLSIKAGGAVVWTNRDPFPRTVRSADGRFRSPEIAPGQSWCQPMMQPGVFPYACSLHPTTKAELRVD